MSRSIWVTLSGGHFLGVVLHAAGLAELHRQCEQRGWRITGVGGLSAGSIIAACYGSGYDCQELGLEYLVREYCLPSGKFRDGQPLATPDYSDLVENVVGSNRNHWPRLYPTGRIREVLTKVCQTKIGTMRGHFRAVTFQWKDRTTRIWDNRVASHKDLDTVRVVSASMAIPIAFPPVEINGQLQTDGGMAVGNTPWNLWSDLDPDGSNTVVLRIGKMTSKKPSKRLIRLATDAIDALVDSLEVSEHRTAPKHLQLIELPKWGDSGNFNMTREDADSLMMGARRRVEDAFRPL